jgi:hypothetical protein
MHGGLTYPDTRAQRTVDRATGAAATDPRGTHRTAPGRTRLCARPDTRPHTPQGLPSPARRCHRARHRAVR